MKKIIFIFCAIFLVSLVNTASAKSTLEAVKAKGYLACGVNKGLAGFSSLDSKGHWTGIDVDVCRAIAAAIFGDANQVKFSALNAQQRFTALQSGEVDVLSRNTTYTISRDADLGFNFGPTIYYDGQGFLVSKKLNVKSATELGGATICTQSGTTTEQNLSDFFRAKKTSYKPLVMEDHESLKQAFFAGRCDVFTTDKSGLAVIRMEAKNPDDYFILPETISKEPLGPLVRHGDDQWFDILKWSVYALVLAEEFGIHSQNVDEFLKSENPEIKRFLGLIPGTTKALGLDPKWAYHIIKQVGNYGEIFERNVGQKSPLKLERGLNALWTNGGILYAPPVR